MDKIEELKLFLKENGVKTHEVDSKRNYWFVRTDGGNYFDAYVSGNYIGLGWNAIPFTEPDEKGCYPENLIKDLESKGHKQPTRVLNQIKRFYKDMKKGDVVVIPSTSSLNLAFGYISDDEVYTEENITDDDIENGACPYTRRRHVNWIVNIDKARIDPHLYALFRNHQVISDGKSYASYIDRALHTLYIKDGIAHLTFTVEAKTNPKALSIPTFMLGLIERTESFAKKYKIIDDCKNLEDEIDSKINVQSPGVIEFLGSIPGVLSIAAISLGLFGGKIKFEHTKEKTSGEISTGGFAGSLISFLKVYNKDKHINDDKMQTCKKQLQIKNINDDEA